jgi:nitrogen fixation protein NifU and related proteins
MISFKIIKIASNTKFFGLENIYTHKSSLKNSICGDKIKLEIIAEKLKIKSMRYETESCVYCEASASLIANKIKKFTTENIKEKLRILIKKIKENDLDLPSDFKEFKYLMDKDSLSRTNCIILPLDSILKALKL